MLPVMEPAVIRSINPRSTTDLRRAVIDTKGNHPLSFDLTIGADMSIPLHRGSTKSCRKSVRKLFLSILSGFLTLLTFVVLLAEVVLELLGVIISVIMFIKHLGTVTTSWETAVTTVNVGLVYFTVSLCDFLLAVLIMVQRFRPTSCPKCAAVSLAGLALLNFVVLVGMVYFRYDPPRIFDNYAGIFDDDRFLPLHDFLIVLSGGGTFVTTVQLTGNWTKPKVRGPQQG